MSLNSFASVVTAVGVVFVVAQLRQTQRQRHRQFEDLYLGRYWMLLDRMPGRCEPLVTTHAEPMTLEADDQLWVMAYIRLSEDQAEMRANGWVTDETWRQWAEGIAAAMTRWPYSIVWSNLSAAEHQFAYIREFGERNFDASGFDPIQLRPWARWLRGLDGLLDRVGNRPR